MRRSASNSVEADSDQSSVNESCPECETGTLQHDEKRGEQFCQSCGLVIETDEIDHGPEWRSYSGDGEEQTTRVGSPRNKRKHDHGLATEISWKNKDGHGQPLSAEQKKQAGRLRKWNKRFQTKDSQERVRRKAFGEINRLTSELDIPPTVAETASDLFREVQESNLLKGRSYEAIATGCLYAATRKHQIARPISQFASIARVRDGEDASSARTQIFNAYTTIKEELDLNLDLINPACYVAQIITELAQVSPYSTDRFETIEYHSTLIAGATLLEPTFCGSTPIGIAAGAVYYTSLINEVGATQEQIAEAADVTTVTIRNQYQRIMEHTDDPESAMPSSPGDLTSEERKQFTETSLSSIFGEDADWANDLIQNEAPA